MLRGESGFKWVDLEYEDLNRTGRFGFKEDRSKSLKLISLAGYRWLNRTNQSIVDPGT